MPLIGSVPEGTSFFCPRCGALYSVTHAQRTKRESNIARCVICLHTMDTWDSITVPIYKLVQRPEDD
jgi:transcription elongation factor Elf1